MSIVIKKIHRKRYAYLVYRRGKKIVQKYLGLATHKEVQAKIQALQSEKRIPEEFYPLFWDANPKTIDLKLHKQYVIERVLELGPLSAFFWIQRIYPTKNIIEVCLSSRRISERSRKFWKTWFGLRHAY
jgi:hypothetical protein